MTTRAKSRSGPWLPSGTRLRALAASSRRHLVISSLLLLPAAAACALDIEFTQATYADKHYEYELVALLDAPVDRVQEILRDYPSYTQLDPRILEAKIIGRPSDYVTMLETAVRVCFGPFCRNVKRIERVEESPLELVATADPTRSDVKFGETRMMLSVTDGRTRVSYRTSIVPDFWIPAFAGRRWLLETLEDGTIDLFRRVEARAQADAQQGH